MLTKLKQRKNKNYLREKINYNICICFSAFYKTKLFSWILTLVNFASERNKTLFSGGTRREAWERPTPLFSDPPKGPRDKQTLLLPPPPSHTLFQGPDDLGPLLSHLLLSSLVLDPIFYIQSTTSGILRWSLYLRQSWLTQDETAIKCLETF